MEQFYVALYQRIIREIPVYLRNDFYKNLLVAQNESITELATELFKDIEDAEYYTIVFREFGVPIVTLRYINIDPTKIVSNYIPANIWFGVNNYLTIKLERLTGIEIMANARAIGPRNTILRN